MPQENLPITKRNISGWLGIGLMVSLYVILYVSNFLLPLDHQSYTMRIWNWSELALTVTAVLALVLKWRRFQLKALAIGAVLGVLNALSHSLQNPDLWVNTLQGGMVWICFLGGAALFQDLEASRVAAFQPPITKISRSLLIGVAIAIPFAAINNLFFYLTSGAIRFRNVFYSAFKALSPGISEEIVFRFFILALCLSLLKGSRSPRLAVTVAILLAVVPHSLNHLPDLFLENPVMGLFMFIATSLLFGLPMALVQIKRNLETAIAFHWFVDFARFLFGF